MQNKRIDNPKILLLLELYESKDFVSAKQLQEKLSYSLSTIRNEIRELSAILEELDLGQIKSKPRMGTKLNISQREWEKLIGKFSLMYDSNPISNSEIGAIAYLVLTREKLGYTEIEKNLFVNRSIAAKHFTEVKKWLSGFNIKAEYKKRIGFITSYEEFDWRFAMLRLFLEEDNREPFSEGKTGIEQRVREFLNGFNSTQIAWSIHSLEKKFGIMFSDESYLQLLFLTALSILRSRGKRIVKIDTEKLSRFESNFDLKFSEAFINQLEEYYSLQLPADERKFIYLALQLSEIKKFRDISSKLNFEIDNFRFCSLTIKLTKEIGSILEKDLLNDIVFIETLLITLRSMIPRLLFNVEYTYSMIWKVARKYPSYMMVAWACESFFHKELGVDITNEDVSLLAILIAGAVKRSNPVVNAAVICDYGVGISQLLKERLEREVNGIFIKRVYSKRDIDEALRCECELIISTIRINSSKERPVIVVDHALLDYDVESIKEMVKKIGHRKYAAAEDKAENKGDICLFDKNLIAVDLECAGKEEVLTFAYKKLKEQGYVKKGFLESALERERSTPTGIGNLIAIPHGNSDMVKKSAIFLATLKKEIAWGDDLMVDFVFFWPSIWMPRLKQKIRY